MPEFEQFDWEAVAEEVGSALSLEEIEEWDENDRRLATAAVLLHRALVPFLDGSIANILLPDFFGYKVAKVLLNDAVLNKQHVARVINTAILAERYELLP